jgi:hypothetical protein
MSHPMRLLDLFSKPIDEQFTDEEITFIKKYVKKSDYKVFYCLRKKSNRDLYVALIIDSSYNKGRRTLAWNSYDKICSRDLTNGEYQEIIENYGSNNRVLKVYYYKSVEYLIKSDSMYNVVTPPEYIEKCKEMGYSSPIKEIAIQTTLNF